MRQEKQSEEVLRDKLAVILQNNPNAQVAINRNNHIVAFGTRRTANGK